MDVILVDSDVLIAVLRGYASESASLENLLESGGGLAFSPVSRAEVFAGMRPGEEAPTRDLFGLLQCLPLTDAVGERAGFYLRDYRRSHGVQLPDALIAATSCEHDAALWTRNWKHYPMPDLRRYRF